MRAVPTRERRNEEFDVAKPVLHVGSFESKGGETTPSVDCERAAERQAGRSYAGA